MTLGQNLLSPTGNVKNNQKSGLTLCSHSLGRNPNSFNGNNVCDYKMVSSKEAFSMRAKIQTSQHGDLLLYKSFSLTGVSTFLLHQFQVVLPWVINTGRNGTAKTATNLAMSTLVPVSNMELEKEPKSSGFLVILCLILSTSSQLSTAYHRWRDVTWNEGCAPWCYSIWQPCPLKYVAETVNP